MEHVLSEKRKPWEFFQFPFSDCVLVAERRIGWYDDDKLEEIRYFLKRKYGVRFFWNEASDYDRHMYTKHTTKVELYKKYDDDVSFQEKIEDMEQIIKKIRALN